MNRNPDSGDRVRIEASPVTVSRGFADREGVVYGWSVPSSSGVGPIIGHRGEDFAYSVYFADTGEQEWFAPHLVKFVAGGDSDVRLAGFDRPRRSS